ncbi:MAG: CoA transferase [Deltaproteobacteria bacterium]|nr:CoA transferase [Deltaproteobacteria bacterium]
MAELVTAAGPLSGVLVIDLTRVLAGPYCTMVLADLGARVIKVEMPGRGDDARAIGPFVGERSAYFMSLNRGKESIALDLKDADDRSIFERLLARADVLVENFRPGAMERLGYGWDELHARFPRLIAASTSGFGQTGPYAQRPAYDVVAHAMGGVMSITGEPGGRPTRVGTSIGDIAGGLFTAIGIQAALVERQRSGAGQRVDVSLLDAQVAILENAIARYAVTGEIPGPIGSRHPSIAPFDAFATRDGYIVIAAGNDALFARLCEAVGAPEWTEDERFRSNELRNQNADALKQLIESALAHRATSEWLEVLQRAELPCGPLNDIAQLIADPQVTHRNMIVSAEDETGDGLQMAGNPIKLSAHEDPTTRPAAPALDADRRRILAELEAAEIPPKPPRG